MNFSGFVIPPNWRNSGSSVEKGFFLILSEVC
jgi:hypothetical protein